MLYLPAIGRPNGQCRNIARYGIDPKLGKGEDDCRITYAIGRKSEMYVHNRPLLGRVFGACFTIMTEECASQDGNARMVNASGEFRQTIYTAIAGGGARTHRVGSQYPQDE